MDNPIVLILLINYFNDKQTIEFASQLINVQQANTFKILICNNGTNNETIIKEFVTNNNRATLYNPDKNLGYLGGANAALNEYVKSHAMPNFTILCNTDMQISDGNFFENLIALHLNSKYQLIAPNILVSETLMPQNPYYQNRLSIHKLRLLIFVTSNFVLYKGYHLFYELKRKLTSAQQNNSNQHTETMYAMHGSFMIFKKQFFESGGTLNFPSFLFCEEIFIAEQARKLNLEICFEPSLTVLHFEHATTGLSQKPLLVKYLHQSLIIIKKLFFNE